MFGCQKECPRQDGIILLNLVGPVQSATVHVAVGISSYWFFSRVAGWLPYATSELPKARTKARLWNSSHRVFFPIGSLYFSGNDRSVAPLRLIAGGFRAFLQAWPRTGVMEDLHE